MKNIIGERIRECRLQAGLTQEQLAIKIGVTKSCISNIENKRSCSKNVAIKLSKFFNKPLDYFLIKSEKQFIKDKNVFDTSKMILDKLYSNHKLDNISKIEDIDPDTLKLIEKALWFDVKLYLEKKKQD